MTTDEQLKHYREMRAAWLAAIAARRSHEIVRSHWEALRVVARRLHITPGAPL